MAGLPNYSIRAMETRWNFGTDRGWTPWGQALTPTYVYDLPGTYPVQLQVRTEDGYESPACSTQMTVLPETTLKAQPHLFVYIDAPFNIKSGRNTADINVSVKNMEEFPIYVRQGLIGVINPDWAPGDEQAGEYSPFINLGPFERSGDTSYWWWSGEIPAGAEARFKLTLKSSNQLGYVELVRVGFLANGWLNSQNKFVQLID